MPTSYVDRQDMLCWVLILKLKEKVPLKKDYLSTEQTGEQVSFGAHLCPLILEMPQPKVYEGKEN